MLEEDFYNMGEPVTEPENIEPETTETVDTDAQDNDVVEPDIEPAGEEIITGEETNEDEQNKPDIESNEPEQEPQEQTQQPNPFEGKTADEIRQEFMRIQQQRQQDTAFDKAFKNAVGQANPFTGQIIQTADDYKAYVDEHARRTEAAKYNDLFTNMQQGTATKEDFDNYIKSLVHDLPEVREAKEAKIQADKMAQAAQYEKSMTMLKADIDKFNSEMPSCKIKNIGDIQNDSEVAQYINIGLTFDKAYKLAHMDEIMSAKTSAVKQATITNQQNKSHLKATGGNSAESVTVPDNVIAEYKQFFPDWTNKQILEDYKKRV